jgi:hypothetical protein
MNEDKHPFPGMRVPEPPEELRRRVLRRARRALESGPARDRWTFIWESRPARLAWGTSVLALVLCHLVVPFDGAVPGAEPSTLALTEPEDHEDLAAIADLPIISLDAMPDTVTQALEETETTPEGSAPVVESQENVS